MPWLIYLLCLCSSAALWAQNPLPVSRYFKGTVNGQYSITMELKQEGDKVVGHYFYDKYRTNIAVEGNIKAGNILILKEIDASGNPTSTAFIGNYSNGWTGIRGEWQSRRKDRRLAFNLQAIYLPKGPIARYNFDHIRRFQELLNYFDAQPLFPFRVKEGLGENPRWSNWNTTSKQPPEDYQQMIPYRLAKRYIMNQVKLSPTGSYNYFDLPPSIYQPHGRHYTALCCAYRSNRYVGLLCRFECDTGWEYYDLTFLLIFDYAGHLLDACEVGKVVNLEGEGRAINANWSSRFWGDGRVEVTGMTKKIHYADTALEQTIDPVHFYWLLQSDGHLRRKEIGSK
jgi:hypothetical protein